MQTLLLAVIGLLATLLAQRIAAQTTELKLDGLLNEPAWAGAYVCSDWRRVEPFARDTPRFRNEARVLSTPQGLAVGFVLEQPAGERRVKPRTARDAQFFYGESVSFMVDFENSGQVGYEFAVGLGGGVRDGLITNQKVFDRDWDGEWSRAVVETDHQWSVEMLIPWSTVRVRQGEANTRTIRVYFNRQLYDRAERFACPGISYDSAGFLSDFQPIKIDNYSGEREFNVAPYATMLNDNVRDDIEWKAGGEIFWRPMPQLHAALTINPDFGQVESDELVVDFSAIETLFTDKRPFFTEEQGVFDVRTPANGQFIYTRRIGGERDDGSPRSSDIDAALKLTGEAARLRYGVFAAQEDDYSADLGRRFAATRMLMPVQEHRLGHLATWTERPYLDRTALVNEVDYEYAGHPWWRGSAQMARSDTKEAGLSHSGYLASVQADLNRSGALTHTAKLLYIDERYEMNDLGFMERNALRQIEWDSTWRRSYDEGKSTTSGTLDRLYAVYRENADGVRLPSRLQLVHETQLINGWRFYQDVRYFTSGADDLISRGHGLVQQDARLAAFIDGESPRYGKWQYVAALYGYQQGVDGYSGWLQLGVNWFPRESLSFRLDLIPGYSADWLLWTGDSNLFGSYTAERVDLDFRADWFPAPGHELRLRWQWIGIDAEPNAAYRTGTDDVLVKTSDRLPPFTVNNLGLQIRYRYEFAPLSELFVVYSRGGLDMQNEERRGLGSLFSNSPEIRDADQFLIKVRVRL